MKMTHDNAIENARLLVKNNPWLYDNDKEEFKYILEDNTTLPYFDPSGLFGPSYCNHLGTGNECCMATLRELYETLPLDESIGTQS